MPRSVEPTLAREAAGAPGIAGRACGAAPRRTVRAARARLSRCVPALGSGAALGIRPPHRRAHVFGLEVAGLEVARDLGVDLAVARRRFPARLLLALHLELAPALELEDLEHEHEVDACGEREQTEAGHH